MKQILSFSAVLAVIALWIWIKWSQAKRQVKDLGNGGIQTLFDKSSK
jgi:hypothetical protein